ncbi:MAG TPA: zinc-binding alcohol dehydrogenase family protein [Pseudolabrys sp.]|jgi:zinc-binding alcohol dehydrogenase family protein|nr:zinc-binding alcohol dehydrogenase family protein [Pseudolabrys sp.]
MRAVGYKHSLPIDDAQSLMDLEIEEPAPQGRDLLVEVKAVSVNPVDTKVRMRMSPKGGAPKILGYDASGVVVAAGADAKLFKPGDSVFYAGSISRSGTNSQLHLVDERIVGKKPTTLGFAAAAALPLTSIAAWETLFGRLEINRQKGKSMLILGAGGGVGSIAIQLARALSDLTVVATASRPETADWCRELGAHHVIDHSKPMAAQLETLGYRFIDYIFGVNGTGQHYDAIVEIISPQGKLGIIDDPGAIGIDKMKGKSASLHWESMFTRSTFQTSDIEEQHRLLNEVARLIDTGSIKTTLADNLGAINANNLKRAHTLIEGGHVRGKIVLEGF